MSINQYMYYLSKIEFMQKNVKKLTKWYGADRLLDKVVTIFNDCHDFQTAQGILSKIGLSNTHNGMMIANSKDHQYIKKHSPIFYSFRQHRPINESDVNSVLESANRYFYQFL